MADTIVRAESRVRAVEMYMVVIAKMQTVFERFH